MGGALEALNSATRRELQALAKELKLCKGNAKSDVIVSHAMKYLDSHPKDGEQVLLGVLGRDDIVTPVASPLAKRVTPTKQKTADMAVDVETEIKSDKLQPEAELVLSTDSEKTKTVKEMITTNNKLINDDKPALAETAIESTNSETFETGLKEPPPFVKTSPVKTTLSSPTKKKELTVTDEVVITNKMTAPLAGVKARKAVEALVQSTPDLTFVGDSRVRCISTGHEMKADVDIISTYICGKRYQKARNLKLSFAKYAPMFVDHPDESKPDLLWCSVTGLAIVRDEDSVKKHIAGPKYQKQLPIWKQEEATKKKAEEEEALLRAARIEAAKKRRLEVAKGKNADTVTGEWLVKRKRTIVGLD